MKYIYPLLVTFLFLCNTLSFAQVRDSLNVNSSGGHDTLRVDSIKKIQQAKCDTCSLDSLNKILAAHATRVLDSLKQDSVKLKVAATKKVVKKPHYVKRFPSVMDRYFNNDSTSLLYVRYIMPLDTLYNEGQPRRYVRTEPWHYRLFIPFAYYNSPISTISDMHWAPDSVGKLPKMDSKQYIQYDTITFNHAKRSIDFVDKNLIALYVHHPDIVVTSEDQFRERKLFKDNLGKEIKTKKKFSLVKLFSPEEAPDDAGKADFIIHKPNFWRYDGSGSVQFTQNYISKNWHKGGESTNSMIGTFKQSANYNDKEKVQWENLFEAKIGFNTLPSDTLRSYQVNTDLFRLTSKIGLRATTRWYYTFSTEFNTQFFRNFEKNSNTLATSFFAPANLILNLGMDYKINNSALTLSLEMFPATYKLTAVTNDEVDETKFAVDAGKTVGHFFGSTVKATWSWKITSFITWDSRINYFTNYEKVEAEWENTFNFILNQYLSTKLFVHARYDDGVPRVEGCDYFQLKELLSFGLNYTW